MTKLNSEPKASWPNWLEEIDDFLIIYQQIILAGNIHDIYLVPGKRGLAPQNFEQSISAKLSYLGIELILSYDRVDCLALLHGKSADVSPMVGQPFDGTGWKLDTAALTGLVKKIASRTDRTALIIYASQLTAGRQDLNPDLPFFELLATCQKLARNATPVSDKYGRRFNPIIWAVNSVDDLPTWFSNKSYAVHTSTLPMPDFVTRATAAAQVASWLDGKQSEEARNRSIELFAGLTDSLPLSSLFKIGDLAKERGIPFKEIGQAVQRFKIGIAKNPWRDPHLKTRVAAAEHEIGKRVKGQEQAIRKAADILRRSVAGLSGAQASAVSAAGRPKGIMFFVGPTGVGKTELAKAISELIFLKENAYLRFDMSEFSAEHAQDRLIGSPPGYIGHDAGGELTNGIREKPFSVVLFDEIEKAHPRLLDKFLQILEDGRLTDGRGQTAYFSEAIIIFTSNLGSFDEKEVIDERGFRRMVRESSVDTNMTYQKVEEKMRNAVAEHFRLKLGRPEILNRIGENIVVFDFIRDDIAQLIFDKMIQNIIMTVKTSMGVDLVIDKDKEVYSTLRRLCTGNLGDGGRGIGNRLEAVFINPLSRVLFDHQSDRAEVNSLSEKDGVYEITIQ